jgi:hypothetical protein
MMQQHDGTAWNPMIGRAAFLAVLLLLVLPVGCRQAENKLGKWFFCTCAYLTDFDDPAKHSLDVCVPEGADAQDHARGCASKLAHGHVESCTCEQSGEACFEIKACRSKEYQ